MKSMRAVGLIVALAVVVGLWVFPAIAFPNPGVNDAMVLADLTLPVVGAILLASIAVLILGNVRRWPSTAPVALGTFLIGVAVVFVISLVTFGNMSNGRFAPLLLLPVPFGLAGIVTLAVGLTHRTAGAARAGFAIGGVATALLLAWMLARGATDWLQAPYGFDVLLLVALESAIVYVSGVIWRRPARRALSG
jgi:hypothetical protein